jgi:hypothetical protein
MTIPSHRLAPRLIQALLTADAQEVSAVISRAIEGGLGLEAVYLELLSPAQEEVGERWARGLITIAQEHLATDLVRRHMDALRERFPAHTSNGRTVLVGTCEPGVANQVLANGATFNDLIAAAIASASNHGKVVSAITQMASDWKDAGLISGKEKGAITSCVARSSAGKK